eukprot:TRINITY_DN5620_c0_g1_i3.p1 TRINITY_DN5620_c0_g1~~TRINITY_DN5620_c0_g1_i3.p1  ORF type:complete len:556 (+),score=142.90 TRINITY_DN5620_c0_g1_i3:201-1868(+)
MQRKRHAQLEFRLVSGETIPSDDPQGGGGAADPGQEGDADFDARETAERQTSGNGTYRELRLDLNDQETLPRRQQVQQAFEASRTLSRESSRTASGDASAAGWVDSSYAALQEHENESGEDFGGEPYSREAAAEALGISYEDYEVQVATAKLIGGFCIREQGHVGLEKGSVYGAAILMPQMARSAGWPRFLVSLLLRSYVFLFINLALQGGLLYMIQKEEAIMDLFGGQMYLCDFGALVSSCPGHPSCIGPSGTEITPPRMYPFLQWSTRTFLRDSLKFVFPEMGDEIQGKVDPGEYGLESYWCRLLCCFIFMMSVMSELYLNVRMMKLIWYVPNDNEMWLEDTEDFAHGLTWLDAAGVKVAGMSIMWKIINIVLVLVPKLLLWKMTADAGVTFLMETASIEDLIVNSVALTFVLNIDEMMFELMTEATKVSLEACRDLNLYDEEDEEDLPEEKIMELYGKQQELQHWTFMDTMGLFPFKLVVVASLTAFFVMDYYLGHCNYAGGGNFFSKPMYLPNSVNLGWGTALFPNFFKTPAAEEPYWEMSEMATGSHEVR